MAPRIQGLGEIALQVNDIDAMVGFYQDVVGLDLMHRFPDSGTAFFKIADGVVGHIQVLALFDRGAPGDRPTAPATRPHRLQPQFGGSLGREAPAPRARCCDQEDTHAWVRWRSLYVMGPEGNEVEWVAFDPSVEQEDW